MLKNFTNKHKKGLIRFLEIVPGSLAWGIIFMPAIGGLFFPEIVAYALLIFLAYWFFNSFRSSVFAIRGYFILKKWEKINWYKKWQRYKGKKLDWEKIKHVVVIPNYNESEKILVCTVNSLAKQKQIDPKQLIIVLAMEKRAPGAQQRAEYVTNKFKGTFGIITATYHPAGLAGEIVGKASNEAWAAKKIKAILDKRQVDIKNLTITSCDADARFHPLYFASLNYHFATDKNRYLRFWQSPIFWYNNLHKVPFPIRIVGVIGHAIHMADLQEPQRLMFNYSCYSLSFKLLDDVGYWDTNIIPEDWHLFLQTFYAKKGRVEVNPIFLPTSIDAPEAKSWISSLKNRYEQCKRHAWGATDIPYAVTQSFKHSEIPIGTRLSRLYKLMKTHLIWSTNWFVLTFGATIPLIVNPAFARTTLGHNLPQAAQTILTICLFALVAMIIIDLSMRPQHARPKTVLHTLKELVQWVTLPIVTLPMSVLPGLHAQTMLMVGKRLEYKVTEKV